MIREVTRLAQRDFDEHSDTGAHSAAMTQSSWLDSSTPLPEITLMCVGELRTDSKEAT
jgi:hypothetical protein